MPRILRKVLLVVHIAVSVGWVGAVLAYLALQIPALAAGDPESARAAYLMMYVLMRYALIPLGAATLLTGVVQALGTPWGLWRHYWVVISLVLTSFAFVVLLLHLPAVEAMAAEAGSPSGYVSTRGGDLFHSVGGLAVLLVVLALNVVKPRGLTRYGWRRTTARPAHDGPHRTDEGCRTPR